MLIRFCSQRPFIPFTLCLPDGRELHAHHPEFLNFGRYGDLIYYYHPTLQVEVVDTALVLSIRTIEAAPMELRFETEDDQSPESE